MYVNAKWGRMSVLQEVGNGRSVGVGAELAFSWRPWWKGGGKEAIQGVGPQGKGLEERRHEKTRVMSTADAWEAGKRGHVGG